MFKYIMDEYFHQAVLMIMCIHIKTDISHSQSSLHFAIICEFLKSTHTWAPYPQRAYLIW